MTNAMNARLLLALTAAGGIGVARANVPTFTERPPLTTTAQNAASVVAADIDRDGDTDVVTAEYGIDTVAWYENNGARLPSFAVHTASQVTTDPSTVHAADVDGDGDIDILAVSVFADRVD